MTRYIIHKYVKIAEEPHLAYSRHCVGQAGSWHKALDVLCQKEKLVSFSVVFHVPVYIEIFTKNQSYTMQKEEI